ncbi:MAG TPA: hypothetical protein VGM26_06520 [Rhizomicrobium sp.]|jgi:predicted DNA-binding transcriptional regulator AlpA
MTDTSGFYRIWQILGRDEVTEEMAQANKAATKGPKRPRPAVEPLLPISKSKFWAGIKSGKFPPPVKEEGVSMWPKDAIHALLAKHGGRVAGPNQKIRLTIKSRPRLLQASQPLASFEDA